MKVKDEESQVGATQIEGLRGAVSALYRHKLNGGGPIPTVKIFCVRGISGRKMQMAELTKGQLAEFVDILINLHTTMPDE